MISGPRPGDASSEDVMIIVMGQLRIAPADIKAFCQDIRAIDPSGTAGSGCLFYTVAPSDPASGTMLVAERWHNQRALDAHLDREETRAFVKKWSGRMEGDVLRYAVSEGHGVLERAEMTAARKSSHAKVRN
jgi:quinol monooxygenase YgiN